MEFLYALLITLFRIDSIFLKDEEEEECRQKQTIDFF